MLDHAILGLLHRRPLTGYELKKAFDSSIRHFWTADQSHIYRVLGGLAKDGFVTFEAVPQEGKPNRKVYTITEEGRRELLRWLTSEEARRTTSRNPYLVHLFFASLLPDERILEILRDDLEESDGFLSEYQEMSERHLQFAEEKPSRERFFWYLTLDYGIWMQRAFIAWLKRVIERIEDGDPDSADWSARFDPHPAEIPPDRTDGTEPDGRPKEGRT
jgi:PadR family transcriptional regulator AphA